MSPWKLHLFTTCEGGPVERSVVTVSVRRSIIWECLRFFLLFFFVIASSTRLKWRWAQQEAFSHWQLLVFLMELLIRELLRETITVTGCFLFGVFGSVSSEDCTGHRVLTYGINSTEHLFSCIYDKLEGKGYDWINKELICSSRYETHTRLIDAPSSARLKKKDLV